MGKLEKAFLAVKGKQFPVMYNPTDYSTSMSATYGGPEENNKKNQFQQVQHDNFSLSLFFDTYEDNSDVRDAMKPITDLILPTIKKRKFKEPPVCTFVWGKFNYRGVVVNLKQKFTMFLASGIPVRANLDLTLESRPNDKEQKALSNRSSSRKFWTIKANERIDQIAFSALDNSNSWKEIASFNNITHPLVFPKGSEKGRQLVIPDLGH